MKAGDNIITSDGIRSIRPGFGLAPKMRNVVVGGLLKRDVKAGSPVQINDLVSFVEKDA